MTLAHVTKEIRLFSKIGGAILGVVLLFFLFFNGYKTLGRIFFPKPPAPPEEKFGKLASPSFPASIGQAPTQYTINTVDGTLPVFPDRARVYETKKPEGNILALQNVRTRLAPLGYTSPGIKLSGSDTKYQWNGADSVITYDLLTNSFDLTSNFANSALPSGFTESNTRDAIQQIQSLLGNLGEDVSDINMNTPQLSYWRVAGGGLQKVERALDAQILRLDFFQNDIDKLKIYYPSPTGSTMYFLLANVPDKLKIIEGHFHHFPIKTDSFSTYPLKDTQQAYKELQEGSGYIQNPDNLKNVFITDVFLGYYLTPDAPSYAMPIFVFRGNGFLGYISAIAASSISN